MKKINLYIAIFLFSFILISAQQLTIYDQIKQIKSNPGAYTLVIGKNAKIDEVKCASELAGFLGITKSNFADKIRSNDNLVIVGLFSNNEKIAENIGDRSAAGMLIMTNNRNLIIAGSNRNNLKRAVNIVKRYEKNKAGLLKGELTSINLFAPIKEIFSNMIIVYIIAALAVIVGSAALIVHHKKSQQGALFNMSRTAQSPASNQLKKYITGNLRKGYSEAQVRAILSKAGWKPDLLDSVFNDINKSP